MEHIATVNPFGIFANAAAKAAVAAYDINSKRALAGKDPIASVPAEAPVHEHIREKFEQLCANVKLAAENFSLEETWLNIKSHTQSNYHTVRQYVEQTYTRIKQAVLELFNISAVVAQPVLQATVQSEGAEATLDVVLDTGAAPVEASTRKATVFDTFSTIYTQLDRAPNRIDYEAQWNQTSDEFAGAISVDAVKTAGREDALFFVSTDPQGRRILLMKTPIGYVVVFERNPMPSVNQVIAYRAPAAVANMYGVADYGVVTEELANELFGFLKLTLGDQNNTQQ